MGGHPGLQGHRVHPWLRVQQAPPTYSPVYALICKLETNTSTAQLRDPSSHQVQLPSLDRSHSSWARA